MGTRKYPEPNDSPLRRDVSRAITLRGKRAASLRLSLSKAEWFQPSETNDKLWVKWFCWRLLSKNGHNVTSPKYGILHGGLSKRVLERSLCGWFPNHRCVIDDEISLS